MSQTLHILEYSWQHIWYHWPNHYMFFQKLLFCNPIWHKTKKPYWKYRCEVFLIVEVLKENYDLALIDASCIFWLNKWTVIILCFRVNFVCFCTHDLLFLPDILEKGYLLLFEKSILPPLFAGSNSSTYLIIIFQLFFSLPFFKW